jgi:hypothetical protein
MAFVYLVKREGVTLHPSYLRPDGKFNGGHKEAKQYETKEEAETKAFMIITQHPEWVGLLRVVRSPEF